MAATAAALRAGSRSASAGMRRQSAPTSLGPRADIAGRPDAALEQPRFVIEAMGIDEAVRAAQPHGERPALAGVNDCHRCRILLRRSGVPGEEELPRQPCVPFGAFDI